MTNVPYYVTAREIAKQLLDCGHNDWSDRIEEAIRSSSTGTELAMKIRFVLREMLDSGIKIDKKIESQAIELNKKINEAMKP